jgi:hypothetical protein
MELALHPLITASVALVGASMIAVTPVTPPLPDIQVSAPSVQLSAATLDLFDPLAASASAGTDSAGGSDLSGLLSGLDLNGLLSGLDLSGLLSGLDLSGLDSIESNIQQLLILFGPMLVENALNDVVLVLAVFTNELIFAPIGNGLTELGTAIGGISPVLEPIGTIFDDLGGLSTFIGNQIQGTYDSAVTFNQLLFDIPIQGINFGSDLFDLLTGQPTDPAAGLATDFSGLAGGVSADLSGLLGAAPADLSALSTDLLTIF